MRRFPSAQSTRAAFTLVELMVVVIIIGVLISIVIPVASTVRTRARVAETQQWLSQLGSAIDRYYQDFRAYPGPLSNDQIRDSAGWTSPDFSANFPGGIVQKSDPAYRQWSGVNDYNRFTMAENLVLGLLGGLKLDTTAQLTLVYDPTIVGTGPRSLNPGNQKKYAPYIDVKPTDLSWQIWEADGKKTGEFYDEVSVGTGSDPDGADDSIVPEFVDKFSDGMPVLYLRARRGAAKTPANATPTAVNNGIVTQANSPIGNRPYNQYDLDQIIAYTENPPGGAPPIGVGKKPVRYVANGAVLSTPRPLTHGLRTVDSNAVAGPSTDSNYDYPYDAYPYLRNPTLSGPQSSATANQIAREKDKYILISAGADRIYGTNDDITNFGSVGE